MIQSTLTHTEIQLAHYVGMRRAASSLVKGSSHAANITSGRPEYYYQMMGAMAEMAAAKALGCYWPGSWDTYTRDGDITTRNGEKLEVRYRSKAHYDLLLKEDDCPERIYILVTGAAPTFTLRGWIRGRDGMIQEYWRKVTDRPASYFVPQSALRGFGKLENIAA